MEPGKAYAFFECDATYKDIEHDLPAILELTKAPSGLEIALHEDIEQVTGDAELVELAREAKAEGLPFILEATYPGETNRKTANEISVIFNEVHQAYKGFWGAITYRENDTYSIRKSFDPDDSA